MEFPFAKRLKDVGFPQTPRDGVMATSEDGKEEAYCPTAAELAEALSDKLAEIERDGKMDAIRASFSSVGANTLEDAIGVIWIDIMTLLAKAK